jgi:hypothetical protein
VCTRDSIHFFDLGKPPMASFLLFKKATDVAKQLISVL